METVSDISSLRAKAGAFRAAGERLALVPTMGALHAGHLALVAAARKRADRVAVSIFVNPRQFGNGEDPRRYPHREAEDALLLARNGCDLLFAPSAATVYPPGFATTIRVDGFGVAMEGKARPGHFDGVATVVAKLLMMAMPDCAFFGEKDWQQLQLVRRLVVDLDIPVEIVAVPTVRDGDGLALSSRNARLSAAERQVAALLPRLLRETAAALAGGAAAAPTITAARTGLEKAGFAVDYLLVADGGTLAPLAQVAAGARLFVAASLGGTRLIDNMAIPATGGGRQ